jgi:hypothetical protein
MNISDWLDKKEAEGSDVSQIELPDDVIYGNAPDEHFFSRRLTRAESSAQATIRLLLLNALVTGITVEGKTRKPVFTHQEWNGGCLQRIEISLSKLLNHT